MEPTATSDWSTATEHGSTGLIEGCGRGHPGAPMSERCSTDIWLGRGGASPGVCRVAADESVVSPQSNCSMPGSVYAVDVDPVHDRLACGTRAGTVHMLDELAISTGANSVPNTGYLAAGPVISVRLLAAAGLLTSDRGGNVLSWPIVDTNSMAPDAWQNDGEMVCSLAVVGSLVVGLGHHGRITAWGEGTGRKPVHVCGPPPAPPVALSRLVTWANEVDVAAVYPAANGSMVMITTEPLAIRVVPAHTGRWYAAFQTGDRLATLGHDDGQLRLWAWEDHDASCVSTEFVTCGIIDADIHTADSDHGVMVGHGGQAHRFVLSENTMVVADPIPGKDYRVVAAANPDAQRRLHSLATHTQAQELYDTIMTSIQNGDPQDLEGSLSQLESLGYALDALTMRTEAAAKSGDILAELTLRHQLAEMLPYDSDGVVPLHNRYCSLLIRTGQYELALRTADRVAAESSTHQRHMPFPWLSTVVRAFEEGRSVVVTQTLPDIPIEEILAAAQITGQPVNGLWELHRSGVAVVPDARISSADLENALTRSSHDYPRILDTILADEVLLVEGTSVDHVAAVLLTPWDPQDHRPLWIMLHVAAAPTGTQLIRSILVDLHEDPGTDESSPARRKLLQRVQTIMREDTRAALLTGANALISRTLRRCRAAAMSRCGSGGRCGVE